MKVVGRKRQNEIQQNEENHKRRRLNFREWFKGIRLIHLDSFAGLEEEVVRTETRKLQPYDLANIICSIDPNLRASDCSESEINLLCVQFPLLCPNEETKTRCSIYLNIIRPINAVMIAFLDIFFPDLHYDAFKVQSTDVKNYFCHKEINRMLFYEIKGKIKELNIKLEHIEQDKENMLFLKGIEIKLKDRNFNLTKFYAHFACFRKINGKETTKLFLVCSAINILRDLNKEGHCIPNGPSLFLSVISNLDTYNYVRNLYLFVSYLTSMKILLNNCLTNELRKVLLVNIGLIYKKILPMKTNQLSSRCVGDLLKLKNTVYSITTNKTCFVNLKMLFFDYSYFMFESDFKLVTVHKQALQEKNANKKQVDIIYYDLFREINDVYRAIIGLN